MSVPADHMTTVKKLGALGTMNMIAKAGFNYRHTMGYLVGRGQFKRLENFLYTKTLVPTGEGSGELAYYAIGGILQKYPQLVPYPKYIEVEISTYCGFHCIFCEHTAWHEPSRNLSLVDFIKLTGQFDLKWVNLSVSGTSKVYAKVDGKYYYGTIAELERMDYKYLEVPSVKIGGKYKSKVKAGIEWKEAKLVAHKCNDTLFEVTLLGGSKVIVTGSHSLYKRVYSDKGSRAMIPTETTNLKVGDSLAIAAIMPLDIKDKEIDDELLVLAGLWIADGCYGCSHGDYSWMAIDVGMENDLVEYLKALCEKRSIKYGIKLCKNEKNIRFYIYNTQLIRYLRLLGFVGTTSVKGKAVGRELAYSRMRKENPDVSDREIGRLIVKHPEYRGSIAKSIPNWVFTELSDRQIGLFLSGIFTGDGDITSYHSKNCKRGHSVFPTVRCGSSNKTMLEDIRSLLLRLGIVSSIHSEKASKIAYKPFTECFRLQLASIDIFANKVGFVGKDKNDYLQTNGKMKSEHRCGRSGGIRPIREIDFRKIKDIRIVPQEEVVYDFTVKGNENFITNGILAHNTGEGDAFLNPDYLKMIKHLKKRNTSVFLVDSFNLITKDVARVLVESGVDGIYISMDGATKETYESIKVGCNYDRVITNIKNLLEIKKELHSPIPEICFRFVVNKKNVNEMADYVRVINSMATRAEFGDGSKIHFVGLLDFPEIHDLYLETIPSDQIQFAIEASKGGLPVVFAHTEQVTNPSINKCLAWAEPYFALVPEPMMLPCCAVLMSNDRQKLLDYSFGNYTTTPIKEIWNSPYYKWFRSMVTNPHAKVPAICAGCRAYDTTERLKKYGMDGRSKEAF